MLLLLVGYAAPASAEQAAEIEASGWTLNLGVGVQEVISRDEMGSPLAYRGTGYPLALGAELRRSRWSAGGQASAFAFGFNGGRLAAAPAEEGSEGHRADSVFVDLSLWYQRPLVAADSWSLTVGPQIGHWTFFRSYLYNPRQIGSVETWDTAVTGDVLGQWRYVGGSWSGQVAASVSVAGRMMRPSYSIRGDDRLALVESRRQVLREGHWTTARRLRMAQAEVALERRISDRVGIWAQYRVGGLDYRDEVATRAFSQRFVTGIQWRF